MNKKQIIILVAAVLLTAIVVYYLFFRKTVNTEPTNAALLTPPNAPGATASGLIMNDNFPLQIGSHGPKVTKLQIAINKIYPSAGLDTDGIFGKITKDALQGYLGFSFYPVTEDKFNYILDYSALS